MIRVLSLVEGQTERNFGQKVLAPHLGGLNIAFFPRVIGKPGHKGGVRPWQSAKAEILTLLRQEPSAHCTTMFDLYGLRNDWPGRDEVHLKGLKYPENYRLIQTRIAAEIAADMGPGFDPGRFIPYLQVHEYESLLFSNPAELARTTQGSGMETEFQKIVQECGGCEKIDDDPQTAPSKRILKLVRSYDKAVDGILIAQRIGLDAMREACPHFNEWLGKLESLGG